MVVFSVMTLLTVPMLKGASLVRTGEHDRMAAGLLDGAHVGRSGRGRHPPTPAIGTSHIPRMTWPISAMVDEISTDESGGIASHTSYRGDLADVGALDRQPLYGRPESLRAALDTKAERRHHGRE